MEQRLFFFIISEHLTNPHQISEGLWLQPFKFEITFPKRIEKGHFWGRQYKKGGKV